MLKIINQYPEMLTITKPSLKNVIFYNENRYNLHFIESLISIYKFYFESIKKTNYTCGWRFW